MDKKAWIIFSVIVVALFGGLIVLSQRNKIDVSDVDAHSIIAGSEKNGNIGDHVFGNKDSKVVLVEYGDFQCPGCGNAHPYVKTLSEKYKDQIAFVFRNFPLTSIHPNARAAAGAVEAAGLMGKYWEMHNVVFEKQSSWSNLGANERTKMFIEYATSIGLDEAEFKENLEKTAINQKISFDQALGKKVDVSATPTMFLNGTKLTDETAGSEGNLEAAIQAELKKQGVELPKEDTEK